MQTSSIHKRILYLPQSCIACHSTASNHLLDRMLSIAFRHLALLGCPPGGEIFLHRPWLSGGAHGDQNLKRDALRPQKSLETMRTSNAPTCVLSVLVAMKYQVPSGLTFSACDLILQEESSVGHTREAEFSAEQREIIAALTSRTKIIELLICCAKKVRLNESPGSEHVALAAELELSQPS